MKTVYREGDRVKIVTPEVFVRCGYPRCLADYYDRIAEKGPDVQALLGSLGADVGVPFASTTSIANLGALDTTGDMHPWEMKLRDAIAYVLLKHDGFGGRERSIHTRTDPDLEGVEGTVGSKRNVITGTYSPGYEFSDFEGGPDYDPPVLLNRKTHVILDVWSGLKDFEIAAANVIKLELDES